MIKARVQHYSTFQKEVTYSGSSLIYQLARKGRLRNTGVDYVEIKPMTELKPHYHRIPSVIIFVLGGNGFVYLNSREYKINPGDVINIPSKTIHGFRTKKKKLAFLSIQTPPIYGKEAEKDTLFVK